MANKQFETLTEIANGLYVTPTSNCHLINVSVLNHLYFNVQKVM